MVEVDKPDAILNCCATSVVVAADIVNPPEGASAQAVNESPAAVDVTAF